MRFLFWNIHEQPNHQAVAQLAVDRDLDVVILAEAQSQMSHMLSALNPKGTADFHAVDTPGCERVQIFTRFPATYVQALYETPRVTMQHVTPPGIDTFLLVAVHLPSKRNADAQDQAGHCEDLAHAIAEVEDDIGHTRTVLVGDVNQNPFEEGMLSAKALHAVMSTDVAKRSTRKFNSKPYRMFYNPMWGKYGDTTPGPSGTYYHASSKKCETFWHILDQVLVRPELVAKFQNDELEIIEGHSCGSFLNRRGRPSKAIASDHLPVYFEISM